MVNSLYILNVPDSGRRPRFTVSLRPDDRNNVLSFNIARSASNLHPGFFFLSKKVHFSLIFAGIRAKLVFHRMPT
jgi:hypothetical protein